MAKIKWNSEKLLGLSAMAISFFTLLIFIYQTNLIRKQNYISILPYLALSISDDSANQKFEMNLENHGVGPAIVESVTMVYNDKKYELTEYDNEMFKFLLSKTPEMDSVHNFSSSTLDKGMAIPANSTYNIFRVFGSGADYGSTRKGFSRLMEEGLDYEIIYRSIQNERWVIHNNSDGPKKLD